jgi:hypothetical protein
MPDKQGLEITVLSTTTTKINKVTFLGTKPISMQTYFQISLTLAGYLVFGLTGYPALKFCIRPDTVHQKRPKCPVGGRISGIYGLLFYKFEVIHGCY